MLEPFYFALGLVNSGFLIFIFLIRKNHLDLLQRIGWVYFLLAIPAIYAIFLVKQEHRKYRHACLIHTRKMPAKLDFRRSQKAPHKRIAKKRRELGLMMAKGKSPTWQFYAVHSGYRLRKSADHIHEH
jgi:Ca2+/Na+ antiporter